MKNETLFLMLGICFSIFFAANSTLLSDSNIWCAYHGGRCFIHYATSCCEKTDECRYLDGYFVCVTKELVGSPCQLDGDCLSLSHSECSFEKKCKCKPNYVRVSGSTCGPLLGEVCEEGEEMCAESYSRCADNVCQCETNFSKRGSRCLAKYLEGPCEEDDECAEIESSMCSIRKKCVCRDGFVEVNRTVCEPPLGELCSKKFGCAVENSVCIYLACECTSGYLATPRGECVAVSSLNSCNDDADCKSSRNSKCSVDGKCTCNSGFAAVDDNSCVSRLNDYCTEDHHCPIKNSECIYRKCQCKTKYSAINDETCILTSLGKFCQFSYECNDGENLKCSADNICVCRDNFTFFINRCIPASNGFCLYDDQCIFSEFHCVDNKCQCRPNLTLVSTHQCEKTDLLYPCKDSSDCGDPWHSNCVDNKCVCSSNSVAINNATCYSILGGLCWFDHQCLVTNSACINYQCKCKKDYVAFANNLCAPKQF